MSKDSDRHHPDFDPRNAHRVVNDVLARSPVVAFVWAGVQGWPVSFASPNVKRLFGWTAEEFMSGQIQYDRVVHPGDLERVVKEVADSSADPETTRIPHRPYRVIRRDGDVRWVEDLTNIRRGAQGEILAYEGLLLDITQRKEAEERLQQSREQYMLAVKGSNDGIWDWDLRKNDLFLSSRWKAMLGATDDELPNAFSSFEGNLHPDDRPLVLAQIRSYLDGQTPDYKAEFRMRHKDGSYRWILARGQAVRDADGTPIRVAGSHTDITEWKRAEADLRAQSSFIRSLLETAVTPIFYKDLQGAYVDCNGAFADFLGRSREDVIGRTAFELSPPEEARRYHKMDQDLLAAGGQQSYQSTVTTTAGERVVVFHKAVCTDVAGQAIGIVGVITDITEQERAQREALEKEELVRSILASAPVGIMLIEPRTHEIILANDKACDMLGYPRGDLQGRFCIDTICPLHQGRCPITDHPDHLDNFECRLTTHSGQPVPVLMSASEIHFDGRRHLLETFIDLTARKALEAQALQAEKLAAIGQLAAGIAHEINTPTQFVGDNTRFLQDAFSALATFLTSYARLREAVSADPRVRSLVEAVALQETDMDVEFLLAEVPQAIEQSLEGVRRITEIVAAMKAFSHPGAADMSPSDINAAIRSTATVSRNEWKYVADLELDLDDELPMVPCVLGELNQAMLNMVVNAAQAIGEQGQTAPGRRGKITIATRATRDHVEIRIADDGPGMAENIRERVFEPFFTTKDVGKGTGQGLSIARHVVVEKHSGELVVDSTPGTGTCFTIRLPLREKRSARDAA